MSCLIVAEMEWGIKIKNENSLVLFHTSNIDSNCKNPQTKEHFIILGLTFGGRGGGGAPGLRVDLKMEVCVLERWKLQQ